MLAQLVQAPACCELLTIGRLQWLATRAEGSIPIRHGILKLLFFDLVKCSRLCVACGRRKRCMFRRLELCSTTESKTRHAILHLPSSTLSWVCWGAHRPCPRLCRAVELARGGCVVGGPHGAMACPCRAAGPGRQQCSLSISLLPEADFARVGWPGQAALGEVLAPAGDCRMRHTLRFRSPGLEEAVDGSQSS